MPPLPESLAPHVSDTWPRPPGYKPPPAPAAIPVQKHQLLPDAMPPTQAVGEFLDVFGATLQNPAVFIDAAGSAMAIGAAMFIPERTEYRPELGDEQFKMTLAGKEGRKKYMLLLADTVADPQEIWVSWETVRTGPKEGSKRMVRHYLKSFQITDLEGKVRYLMAIFRKSALGWEGVTTFHSSNPSYINNLRRGHLAYKK